MRIFGIEIFRPKAKAMSAVHGGGGWFNLVREGFAGAFQSVIQTDAPRSILAFSAVFSCVTLIASDIAKLCVNLVVADDDGVCSPAPKASPFWAVLRKPNHFQTRIQFIEQWIISKLLYGNTYVLKQRDNRSMVVALYILDAQRVTPMVTEQGDVYYQLNADHLAGLQMSITVPASEIIHDRINCLWHPLVGISPIYACGMSATMGNKIQANSTRFFQNMSRPSGMLTAPGAISPELAARLKASWDENFTGLNLGKVAVLGDGLKYEAMTVSAIDAQLIDQLKWTVEDVARCFHMPLFKIGAAAGLAGNLSVEAQQQLYLNDCLQIQIESLELCLNEGLALKDGYSVEVDEEGLLRMDGAAKAEAWANLVKGMIASPNEARKAFDLKPVAGGESPLAQQQNYSLAALAKRDAKEDPFASSKPASASPAAPEPAGSDAVKEAAALADSLIKKLLGHAHA